MMKERMAAMSLPPRQSRQRGWLAGVTGSRYTQMMPTLLDQLASATQAAPAARKILVAPDLNAGRDLLTALALRLGGWVGWEVETLRSLAGELAMVRQCQRSVRVARDLEISALVDMALDELAAAGQLSPAFTNLAGGLGFRRAVLDAVLELRMAGVTEARLSDANPAHPEADLALILRHYRQALQSGNLSDPAAVFEHALASFDEEAAFLLSCPIFLMPGLTARGLPAQLGARLSDLGATALSDPAASPESTGASFTLFMAASPADEVREALRRIGQENLRWDEVELVATDPDTYGIALEAIACRQEIPITYYAGLPLARSRLGRIVTRWFEWIEQGLPDRLLRQAVETGDLAPEGTAPSPELVRLLRFLAIGWGRDRYLLAGERLRAGIERPRDREYPEDANSEADWVAAAQQLLVILDSLLGVTPLGPEPGRGDPPPVAPGDLAAALLRWLALSPGRDEAEDHARARLTSRLMLVQSEKRIPQRFGLALAQLRETISDFRIWPALGPDRRPWNMTGGHLHLTDLAHAGTTGRRRIFVLGLDAERTAGPRIQDPLLPDAARARLGRDLATTSERREERRQLVRTALASVEGEVTLSWSMVTDGGREASPAPVVLEMARHWLERPALSFEELRATLSPPASTVPRAGAAPFDHRDVWLGAIASGPVLLDGTAQVLERWPALRRGLTLARAWTGSDLTEAHGLVPDACEQDPRVRRTPISASSLQLLAACPLAWLYRHGMRLRPLADPEFTPEAWLDPLQRGLLLHTVYEQFARRWMGRQDQLHSAEAEQDVVETARAVFSEWEGQVPAPNPEAVEAEWQFVEQSARSFLLMERENRGTRWLDCEVDLAAGGRAPSLPLPDGTQLGIWGRIDRIDHHEHGGLVIIDFKTGSHRPFLAARKGGAFRGGRHLQSGVYALAAEQLLQARVAAFEYRFPTPRGENYVVRHDRALLESATGIMLDLLQQIERGEFLPTSTSDDCAYCDFREICRVSDGDFHKVHSPRAEWARAVEKTEPRYQPMRRRRGESPA